MNGGSAPVKPGPETVAPGLSKGMGTLLRAGSEETKFTPSQPVTLGAHRAAKVTVKVKPSPTVLVLALADLVLLASGAMMVFRSGFAGSNGWVGTLLIIGGAILGIGAAVLHDEAGLEAVLRSSQKEESDWQLVRSGIGSLSPGRVYVIRKGANPFVGEVRFGADGTLRVEAVITIAGPATRETALDAPIKEATELCRLKFESGNPIFEPGDSHPRLF